MIDDLKLKELLEDNNLTFPRRIQDGLKQNMNYDRLVEILSILKKLNIPSSLIEKHPDILYTSSNDIRENYRILKYNKLYNYTQEELLEILSKNNEDIKNTYTYLSKKYGNEEINNNISILTKSIQRIKSVERYEQVLLPNAMFSAITSKLTEAEINDVVTTCIRNNIRITPNVFKRTSSEIKSIKKICEENDILILDSIFNKSTKKLKEIIKKCKKNDILISDGIFTRLSKEIEEIVRKCKEKDILLTDSFTKSSKEIEKIIKKYRENDISTSESISIKLSKEIEEIIKMCKEKDILTLDSVAFTKSPKELEEIVKMIKRMKFPFVNELLYCPMDKIELLFSSFTDNKINVKDILERTNEKNTKRILEICAKYNLNIDYNTLLLNPDKMLKVIELCNNYNVKVTNSMFDRELEEIEDIIKYCREKDIKISNQEINNACTKKRNGQSARLQ